MLTKPTLKFLGLSQFLLVSMTLLSSTTVKSMGFDRVKIDIERAISISIAHEKKRSQNGTVSSIRARFIKGAEILIGRRGSDSGIKREETYWFVEITYVDQLSFSPKVVIDPVSGQVLDN
jgi:hypothetical protein